MNGLASCSRTEEVSAGAAHLDNGAPQICITPDLNALARECFGPGSDFGCRCVNDGANVIQIPIAGELIDLVVATQAT